jgi:hypothetical protein
MMAKVKAVQFHSDFCEAGLIKFQAGKIYAKDEATTRCVLLNFGEEITVDEAQMASTKAPEVTQPKNEDIEE